MLTALLLILNPAGAWDRIKEARRGLAHVLVFFVVPLLAITSFVEGYGLVNCGKERGEIPRLKMFLPRETLVYELLQFLVWLGILFLLARLVKSMGETFHGRHTYRQAFVAVAYGLSPLILLRMLDAFAKVSPWVSWSIGVLLSIGVLYQGLPRIMEPDPPHAFGLYLMSSILVLLVTGLFRFFTAWYLEGKFTAVESWISKVAARLPI